MENHYGQAARRPSSPGPRKARSALAYRLLRFRHPAAERVMAKQAVPVLDISPYRSGDDAARLALAAEVDRICREIGFMVIGGHGVAPELIAEVESAQPGFLRPAARGEDAHRAAGARRDAGLPALQGRGAGAQPRRRCRGRPEREPDDRPGRCHRSAYYTAEAAGRHFAPNLWPERPAGLRSAYERYYRVVDALAIDLMRLFALALDLPESYFDASVDRSISRLRVRNYPAPGAARSRGSCAPARTATTAASPSSRPRTGPAACR